MIGSKKMIALLVLFSVVISFVLVSYSENEKEKVANVRIAKQQEKMESKVKKQEKKYKKEAKQNQPAKPATTYLNYTGKLYLQADSVFGYKITSAVKRWNKDVGYDQVLMSGTGQLTDLLISDVSVPYSANGNPTLAAFTNNHLVLINANAIAQLKLNDGQRDRLFRLILAKANGYMFENKKITLKDLDSINESQVLSDVKGKWDEIKADKSYSESLMPIKTDLGDAGVRLFEFYNLTQHEYIDDEKLNLTEFVKEHRDVKDKVLGEKGVPAKDISNAGYKMNIAVIDAFKSAGATHIILSKHQMDGLVKRERTKTTGVITVAGTKSTLGE